MDEKTEDFGALQPVNMMPTDLATVDINVLTKRAEQYLVMQDTIRKLALKLTSVMDWVDEGGKPYMAATGSQKIAMAFGVSYQVQDIVQEIMEDEKGKWIEVTVRGTIHWNNRQVTEVGTGSSRDSFFGVRNIKDEKGVSQKTFLPLSEIDRTDIKKKAVTNFLNRGLKSLIGLSFSWPEIAEATGGKITQELVKAAGNSVGFDKGGKGGKVPDKPETANLRSEIRKFLVEMNNGDLAMASTSLERMTTFTGKNKDGGDEQVPGKKKVEDLTEKQVLRLHPLLKKEYDAMGAKGGVQ